MFARPLDEYLSEAEYLALEATSDIRHEYHGGLIVAMTGGTPAHARISVRVAALLDAQLAPRGCDVFNSDMKVKTGSGRYYYPDVSALCQLAEFTADRPPSLLNPAVVIEVLSDSTEKDDRGKKARHYATIRSLRQYILIAQDEVLIEVYTRVEADQWDFRRVADLEAVIEVSSVGASLPVREVYRNTLDSAEPSNPTETDE